MRRAFQAEETAEAKTGKGVYVRELSKVGKRGGGAKRSSQKTQWLLEGDAGRLVGWSPEGGEGTHTGALRTDLGGPMYLSLGVFLSLFCNDDSNTYFSQQMVSSQMVLAFWNLNQAL